MLQSQIAPRSDGRRTVGIPVSLLLLLTVTACSLLVSRLTGNASLYGQAEQGEAFDVRVNVDTTADQHEPTLAVDPTNPNNLIAAAKDWRTGPKQVWHYSSTDGGRTWVDGHIEFPSELPNGSDPVVTFDAAGTAYIAILGYNQNTFDVGGLYVAQSRDVGRTWSKPVQVSANAPGVFNDKEWITVDRGANSPHKGNVYVSWTLFTNVSPNTDRGDIVVSRSTDGGKTFSTRKTVSLPEHDNTQGSYPAVGPNGEVYVLYYSDNQAAQSEEAKERAEENNSGSNALSLVAQSGGNALYVAKSTDGGQTFPQVVRAAPVTRPPGELPGSEFRMFVLPSLAVDPRSGAIYATWNDYKEGNADTLLTRSTDGGKTWTAPKRVNDDPAAPRRPEPEKDQFFPAIIVGSDGAVHLQWLDRRDDPANRTYTPYYARSTDGGETFSANVPVSHALSNPDVGFEGVLIGDYNAIDVSSDGKRVYTVWVDTRNGNQDIYFSSFDPNNLATGAGKPLIITQPTPVAAPSSQPLTGFSDNAFRGRWEPSDYPVVVGKAARPWIWGPVSFAAAFEPYAQGRSARREVQYFDKARMEINNPGGDKDSPAFVTNGLLVVELIGGRVQIGDNQFDAPRPPSQAPVAGDTGSPDALTYAALAPVTSLAGDKRAPDRTGQEITQVLDRNSTVREDPSRGGAAKLQRYEPVTGHNIPDVFWTFMNSRGPIYNSRFASYSDGAILNWVSDLGYPISEPYWVNAKVAGTQKWVLVQAFQRRVLTYVADNPPGWQVEMGNVGRHYYDWRYKSVPSGAKK